jgi:flagellar hook-basal body complex protein FliE
MSIDASRLMAMRSAILEQNTALQRAAGLAGSGQPGTIGGPQATEAGGFGDALQTALRQVNDSQARASAMTEANERGETTDIAAVMLPRQQASLGFEATLQVRNRLLSAYKESMSIPD